jgi:hypothetical protein
MLRSEQPDGRYLTPVEYTENADRTLVPNLWFILIVFFYILSPRGDVPVEFSDACEIFTTSESILQEYRWAWLWGIPHDRNVCDAGVVSRCGCVHRRDVLSGVGSHASVSASSAALPCWFFVPIWSCSTQNMTPFSADAELKRQWRSSVHHVVYPWGCVSELDTHNASEW